MNSHEALDASSKRLCALPVQLMSIDGGVILVRGLTEICISGDKSAEAVSTVLTAASGAGITRRDLLEQFAAPEREMVDKLVEDLLSRSILVLVDGGPPVSGIETRMDRLSRSSTSL